MSIPIRVERAVGQEVEVGIGHGSCNRRIVGPGRFLLVMEVANVLLAAA
jgi:hypothetical protein